MPTLPRLVVTKSSHAQLWLCYQTHPEIVHVFENICRGASLGNGAGHTGYSYEMFEIYLRELFLPVLERSEVVAQDPSQSTGYRPLVQCLEFRGWENRVEVAQHTKHYADNICSSIDNSDSAENTLLSSLSGHYAPQDAQSFLNELKDLLRKHISRPQTNAPGGVTMRLAVLGKIARYSSLALFAVGALSVGKSFAGGNGYVERIAVGQKQNVEASGSDLFIVNSSSQITEKELRALAGFKVFITKTFGARGSAVSYSIDVIRGTVSYIDPMTGQQTTLNFSDLGN